MQWNHSETYAGVKAVCLLGYNVDKVIHRVLVPWCRAVILLKQGSCLIQNLNCEGHFILSLKKKKKKKTFIKYPMKATCFYMCSMTHGCIESLSVQITWEGHSVLSTLGVAVGGVIDLSTNTHVLKCAAKRRKGIRWKIILTIMPSMSKEFSLYSLNLWSNHLHLSGEPSLFTLRQRQTKKILFSIFYSDFRSGWDRLWKD